MGGLTVVECGCGQTFMTESGERACERCEAVRDPLVCRMCLTTLLVPVASGLCGICDEEWTEHRAVAA